MKNRWIEFFEGGDGRLSMTRLIVFLSFPPSTIVLLANIGSKKIIAELLLWYLSAYVTGYVGGKLADAVNKRRGKKNALGVE